MDEEESILDLERGEDPVQCEDLERQPTPTDLGNGKHRKDEPFKRGRWGVPGTFKSKKGH